MKTAKSLLLLACLAFAACNSLELEQSVPAEVQTSEPEGTITSKVTGQRYNASIVEAGKMIVKFNSDFTAEIEAYDGNVQCVGISTHLFYTPYVGGIDAGRTFYPCVVGMDVEDRVAARHQDD